MSDVTCILTAIEQGDAKSTDELLPLVAGSGGHPACRRAGASSPAEKTSAIPNRSNFSYALTISCVRSGRQDAALSSRPGDPPPLFKHAAKFGWAQGLDCRIRRIAVLEVLDFHLTSDPQSIIRDPKTTTAETDYSLTQPLFTQRSLVVQRLVSPHWLFEVQQLGIGISWQPSAGEQESGLPGGRRRAVVSDFAWAAPFVDGLADRTDDQFLGGSVAKDLVAEPADDVVPSFAAP